MNLILCFSCNTDTAEFISYDWRDFMSVGCSQRKPNRKFYNAGIKRIDERK